MNRQESKDLLFLKILTNKLIGTRKKIYIKKQNTLINSKMH